MLATLENGDAAEVGIVSNEGLAGLALLLDDEQDDLEGVVQIPDLAFRISTEEFRQALDQIPALRYLLHALVHHGQWHAPQPATGGAMSMTASRWLLMAHDRADEDTFQITHDMLAMTLAVRRAGVAIAAGALQKAGLIRYERGRIDITDRDRIEAASCSCYGVTRRAQDRLFGLGVGKPPYRR